MTKENFVNCSPDSMFGNGKAKAVRSRSGGEARINKPPFQDLKRRSPSQSRLSAPPTTIRGSESSPFASKMAGKPEGLRRVVGPRRTPEDFKKFNAPRGGPSPVGSTPINVVQRLSVPSDGRKQESRSSSIGILTNRNSLGTRKSSLCGKRLSAVKASKLNDLVRSESPKHASKENVERAVKKTVSGGLPKQSCIERSTNRIDLEGARTKTSERKPNLVKTQNSTPTPSYRLKTLRDGRDEFAISSRISGRQLGGGSIAPTTGSTRKLSMIIQREQRLQDQNEKLEQELRKLRDEMHQKDLEIERLRSASLVLNNLAKNRSDEVRDLTFQLRETINENAEVRDICRKLEKERQEFTSTKKSRELSNETLELQLASLTSQLECMGVGLRQPTKEFQYPDFENYPGNEGHKSSVNYVHATEEPIFEIHNEVHDCNEAESGDSSSADVNRTWRAASEETEEGPVISSHDDVRHALQDLQDILLHEETSLKERCAEALLKLNVPISPLLTEQGVLDVDSLKALVVNVSPRGTAFSTHRFNSAFRF